MANVNEAKRQPFYPCPGLGLQSLHLRLSGRQLGLQHLEPVSQSGGRLEL